LFLAEPSKLSIFSYDICFDLRLNHEQNKKNWFFFWKKNIYDSQPSEPTPMCNIEVMVEQPQCASIYKESALISEQPLTRIDIANLIRDPSNRS
jgi:hypothetical protein